ncbi:MAG: hypothetical protein OJF61_000069 [Rhodanobacteraceae bacterium]|nr:MAG: hypothetical protein OJF61_000069 [Rhodanobacteraceae bacterium]
MDMNVLRVTNGENAPRHEAGACDAPNRLRFIRTFRQRSTAADRRLRHSTGSADLSRLRKRSRARPCGPTAGGELRPALKTLPAVKPARAF